MGTVLVSHSRVEISELTDEQVSDESKQFLWGVEIPVTEE